MAYWKDNADSYLCSACGYECSNPNKLEDGPGKCPECGSKMGMTNADHLRAMSDKELALFLCALRCGAGGGGYPCSGCVGAEYCSPGHSGMIGWLQDPEEVDYET